MVAEHSIMVVYAPFPEPIDFLGTDSSWGPIIFVFFYFFLEPLPATDFDWKFDQCIRREGLICPPFWSHLCLLVRYGFNVLDYGILMHDVCWEYAAFLGLGTIGV